MRTQNRYLKNYLKQCFENLSDLMKDIKCIDLVASVNIKQEYKENFTQPCDRETAIDLK